MVSRFADALFAVFYGFGGAVANACHAVRAFISPNRQVVFEFNIIHGAIFGALPTADARFLGIKCVCLYKEFIKNRVYRTAHKTVI